jgi:YD repeat-containing protein
VLSTTNAVDNKDIGVIAGKVYGLIKTGISMYKSIDEYGLEATIKGFIIGLIRSYVISTVITCLTDPPFKKETMTMTFNSVVNHNLLPNMYKKVNLKIYSGTNLQSGKTVYTFTSPDDFPLILPASAASFESKPRGYMWMYGLPKTIQVFDNNGKLIKQTDNDYNQRKNDVQDPKTSSCNCVSYWQESLRSDEWNTAANFNDFTTTNINDNGLHLKVDPYNIVTGHSELKATSEKTFNKLNEAMTSSVNYFYNPTNNLLALQNSVDSKGNIIEIKNYYVEDYNLSNSSNSVLSKMKNDNILNVPISTETWQTKPGQSPELLSTSVTEFGVAPNGDYKPVTTYGLQTDKPVPLSSVGAFDPDNLIRNRGLIKPVAQFNYDYWAPGPKEMVDIAGNRVKAFLYRYPDGLPVATITNANADDCYYISSADFTSNNTFFSKSALSKESKITYRASTGSKIRVALGQWNGVSWVFSDINPDVTETIANGGVYYEYTIPQGYQVQVRNENNCHLDEFRFYPKNASMQTVAYDAAGRKISECDSNNRSTYYEYDGLGRITKVFDENHNIIKTYEYHFKN